jgi:6-phosphogluconolactonase
MQEFRFDTRKLASIAAAERIVAALRRRLDAQGAASLVVSGGSTPAGCFAELAQSDLPWADVHVFLSDERWTPADSEDSNERLVRETLLQGAAREAELVPMYRDGISVEERCEHFLTELKGLPFPFACALLGMGADGHFASLFPDAENLAEGLDSESSTLCIPVRTAASPYTRVSLTLAALSRSDEAILLIFGDDKWQTLQAAKASANGYPVSRLLRQKRAPVSVYWAP